MTRSAYKGPDFRDHEQRVAAILGLRQRLEERQIKFLPLKSVRWFEDMKK